MKDVATAESVEVSRFPSQEYYVIAASEWSSALFRTSLLPLLHLYYLRLFAANSAEETVAHVIPADANHLELHTCGYE